MKASARETVALTVKKVLEKAQKINVDGIQAKKIDIYKLNQEGFLSKLLNNLSNIDFYELDRVMINKLGVTNYRQLILGKTLKTIKDLDLKNIRRMSNYLYIDIKSNKKLNKSFLTHKVRFAAIDPEGVKEFYPNKTEEEIKKLKPRELLNLKCLVPAFNNTFAILLQSILLDGIIYTEDLLKIEITSLYSETNGIRETASDKLFLKEFYKFHSKARSSLIDLIRQQYDGELHQKYSVDTSERVVISHPLLCKIMKDEDSYELVEKKVSSSVFDRVVDVTVAGTLEKSIIGQNIANHCKKNLTLTQKFVGTNIWSELSDSLLSKFNNGKDGYLFPNYFSLVGKKLGDLSDHPCALDSIPMPTSSNNIYYKSRGHDSTTNSNQDQLKLTILYSINHHLPILGQYSHGNSHDAVIGVDVIDSVYLAGFRNLFILTDKGFSGENFYNHLQKYNYKFVSACKMVNAIKDIVKNNRAEFNQYTVPKVKKDHNNPYVSIGYTSKIEKKLIHSTLFNSSLNKEVKVKDLNTEVEGDLNVALILNLDSKYNLYSENLHNRVEELNKGTTTVKLTSEEKRLLKTDEDEDGKLTYSIDKEKLEIHNIVKHVKPFIFNFKVKTWEEILSIYQFKTYIEVLNKNIKTQVDGQTARAHTLENLEARHIVSCQIHKMEQSLKEIVDRYNKDIEEYNKEALEKAIAKAGNSKAAVKEAINKFKGKKSYCKDVETLKEIISNWTITYHASEQRLEGNDFTPEQITLAKYFLSEKEVFEVDTEKFKGIEGVKEEKYAAALIIILQKMIRKARKN